MASAPWQSWFMDVRAVYRWEKPRTTAKWFLVYLVLWYTQHVMGFLVSLDQSCQLGFTQSVLVQLHNIYGAQESLFSYICRVNSTINAESNR